MVQPLLPVLQAKPWCIRVASVATSAIPNNVTLPVANSATARGLPPAQQGADDSDFSTVLAQTNAASPKPPTMSDPLGRSRTAPAKPSAATSSTANTVAVKATGQGLSVTMPKIADPKQAATAQPLLSGETKSSSANPKKAASTLQSAPPQKQAATPSPVIGGMQTGPVLTALKNPISEQKGDGSDASADPKKASPASDSQPTASQKQDAPTSPFIGGMQTGPGLTALKNLISGQNGGSSENSDPAPEPVSPNQDQVADKAAANTPTPPGVQAAKPSASDDADPEQIAELSAALQDAAPDISSVVARAPSSAAKTAATAQPQGKAPNTSQLNTLLQSLEPTTRRESTAPAPQAQSSTAPSDTNAAAQPAQTPASDNGNSSNSHSHNTQSSSDGTSPQTTQQPAATSATAAVAPLPAAASTSSTIATLTANNTSGISVAAGTQNAGASASGAALQVAPAQTNAQAAQPDLAALAINIAAKSQAGAKQFDISLEPAELGRVEVRLTVDGAGNAQAHLVAERPETLQMLQRDSGTLTHALKESGVRLGDNGLQFSLKGQQQQQGDGAQQNASRARPLALSAVTSAQSILPVSSSYGLAFSQAGIDIRV